MRLRVLATPGKRRTTRIITTEARVLKRGGPYRFVRHPGCLMVMVEIAGILLVRITSGEAALSDKR